MFSRADRIEAFASLAQSLGAIPADEFQALAERAQQENGWFTLSSVKQAFEGLHVLLQPDALRVWASRYPEVTSVKTVGVAMAGNIPLVGFHDFLSVLLSGHRLRYKPSSKDTVLLNYVRDLLLRIEPRLADSIEVSERLNGVDAIIATGSDNTSRYFEYYFRHIPHIIRKNRVSCAVIQGDEPAGEFNRLGSDVFSYYGLGCRNVASVFVPRDFALAQLLDGFSPFANVMKNHKYENNYTYQKSLLMLNQEKFLDSGYLILKQDDRIHSPIGVLHYTPYDDLAHLRKLIESHREKLQVIVSAQGWYEGSIPFGTAQTPKVDDYADGLDTMKFLASIK